MGSGSPARPREDLQTILEDALGSGNVYFQPPANVRMSYPCIVYERSKIQSDRADDLRYRTMVRYQVTVIDKDPDSSIIWKLCDLPLCSHNRHFVSDNLHHDVFDLYF